ncbi:hypothetical protein K3180_02440 [Qipengyuania sp. YG19]|nr:hypothetical protein [Qipengyuania huizhouensis]
MVQLHSSQTQFIREYERHFPRPWNKAVHFVHAQGRLLDVRIGKGMFDSEYLGVFDGEKLIAIMNTWAPVDCLPHRHIGKTIVERSYQGHGITRQLIEWWVQTHGQCLASDENQTHDGAYVWKSMIKREPRLSFSLWRPDGREEPIRVCNGCIVPDPWAEQHTRLLARPA